MDRLDRWSFLALAALLLSVSFLISREIGKPENAKTNAIHLSSPAPQVYLPELDHKMNQAKKFLHANNLEKTESLVDSLLQEYPFDGNPYMIKGDLLMRRQQPIAAMHAYKDAVDLNPDFLDKKTPLFQGKKIKVSLHEAQAAIETGLQAQPHDQRLKKEVKVLYYMRRKLAGSCG